MFFFQTARERGVVPVDSASLRALRALYGLTLFVAIARFAARGLIHTYYIEPRHFFSYWGFAWVPRPSATVLYLLFALMAVTSLTAAFGKYTRTSLVTFALAFSWVELLDRTNYLNHYYFVSIFTFLLACLPLNATTTVPAWTLWVPRVQLGMVYFFAGIAKLKADWLLHGEPMRTWLLARTDFPIMGGFFGHPLSAYAMSWAGVAFDLGVPFALMHRRTRPWAYAAVVIFHASTGALFNIGMFPWIMVGATTIFFEPSWPRRFAKWFDREPTSTSAQLALPSKPLTAIFAAHFALQIVLPLRMHFYPGDPCWTEQGFRFAWHVMVMEKAGDVHFKVRDATSGQTWVVSPEDFLTRSQARIMAATPDMILSAAHMIHDDFARRGFTNVEVRAEVFASLHGSGSRRLVNPHIDLAREQDTLAPYHWVYPDPHHAPLE
jgi:vitamin K-dependent gamma-carboxylase